MYTISKDLILSNVNNHDYTLKTIKATGKCQEDNFSSIHINTNSTSVVVKSQTYENSEPTIDLMIILPDGSLCMLSEWALSQLCNIIHLPKTYLDNCLKLGLYNLVEKSFAELLKSYNKNVQLFIYHNTVRGVVSEKYSRYSHLNIINQLDGVEDNFLLVNKCQSPDYLHLRFVGHKPFYIDKSGSPLFLGFVIQNSEVGRSCLSVNQFVYRQICTNGLMSAFISKAFKKRHTGKNIYRFNIHDVLESVDADYLETLAIKFCILENNKLSRNVVDGFLKSNKLETSIKLDDTLDYINAYDLVNDITAMARTKPIEVRNNLECVAGKIFDKYSV